jgi:nicotinamide mononucleotide transporter
MAVATVLFNIRQVHWGWPLAVLASSMYCVLFWQNRLYGNAALHFLLASLALWGWWQWLRGTRPDGAGLRVSRLSRRGRFRAAIACALLWPATGLFLRNFTDSDVPWWDAFPTSVSLVAQFLLARKFLENWALWIVVDVVSIGLYGYKGLWLTAGLYTLFIVLCVAGWRRWARQP